MTHDKWLELLPVYGEDFLTWSDVLSAYQRGEWFQVSDAADVFMTRSQVEARGYRARLRYGARLQHAQEFYEWEHE